MVFAREVDGRDLTFGVSGKLIMNAVVLYDHQTDSLWSQFLSLAVDGPLAGTKLDLLPAQLTTWGSWRDEHPETLLLDRSRGLLSRGGDRYASYYASSQTGILGEANKDRRLLPKELVVGLDWGATQRVYPYQALQGQPVVNDAYEGAPIVVAFDPETRASAVFSPLVRGEGLTFRSEHPGSMRDEQTGSRWSTTTGEAIDGPLEGTSLERFDSFVAFWFAWSDFYPETEIYESIDAS